MNITINRIVTLDIETENTGYDIMKDNKRIISVQMFDGHESSIFYDGSDKNSVGAAKSNIKSQIDEGYKFVGFNIRNFDIPLIKEFLGVEIPAAQIVEIGEMQKMRDIKQRIGKDWPKLVEICDFLGIECSHKNIMDEHSLKFKNLPHVIKLAKEGAEKLQKEKNWSYDYSYNRVLDKISGGMAILDSFNEFVRSGGDTNSLFYKYAMGDVFSEHHLFETLKKL